MQDDRANTVGVVDARGHADGFARLRENRAMRDFDYGRPGVRNARAVLRARRAEVCGDRQSADGFEMSTAQAQQNLRMAVQPAGARANGHVDVCGDWLSERRARVIGHVVTAICRVQTQ